MLVGEPGLGRRMPGAALRRGRGGTSGCEPSACRAGAGGTVRRPRRRVLVRFDLAAAPPSATIVLRLAEGQAQKLLTKLEPGQGRKADLGGALADLQAHYAAALPRPSSAGCCCSGLVPGAARRRSGGRAGERAR